MNEHGLIQKRNFHEELGANSTGKKAEPLHSEPTQLQARTKALSRGRQRKKNVKDYDQKLDSLRKSLDRSSEGGNYLGGMVHSLTINQQHSGQQSYSSLKKSLRSSFNQFKNVRFKN